jgi:hypothetical protein
VRIAAFDATDFTRLERFLAELPGPIDHVLVTAGGNYYVRLADLDFTQARRQVDEHLWLPLHVARAAAGKVRPTGTPLFMRGTGARRPGLGGGAGCPACTLARHSAVIDPSQPGPSGIAWDTAGLAVLAKRVN